MQMMYQLIAKEIKSMKLPNSHPQDYLNFYCLGNREQIAGSGAQVSEDAAKVRMSLILPCVGTIKCINRCHYDIQIIT